MAAGQNAYTFCETWCSRNTSPLNLPTIPGNFQGKWNNLPNFPFGKGFRDRRNGGWSLCWEKGEWGSPRYARDLWKSWQ